jgi:hypothetical protein
MHPSDHENGYFVEPDQDQTRRHRYLVKVIAAWAVAAVAFTIWTFIR